MQNYIFLGELSMQNYIFPGELSMQNYIFLGEHYRFNTMLYPYSTFRQQQNNTAFRAAYGKTV